MSKTRVPTTKLTRELYERHGFDVDLCHRTIPGTRIAKDLFGVFDMIAVGNNGHAHWIQYTDWSDISKRQKKIFDCRAAHALALIPTNRVVVIAWRKLEDRRGEYEGKLVRFNFGGVWSKPLEVEEFLRGWAVPYGKG